MRNLTLPALLAATATLAGCFGGGGDESAMPPAADPLAAVPAVTATSIGATFDYQMQLATLSATAESREPIDLTGVTLAASETDEPISFN